MFYKNLLKCSTNVVEIIIDVIISTLEIIFIEKICIFVITTVICNLNVIKMY